MYVVPEPIHVTCQANWAAKYVCLEALAHWTGHDLRGLSALFEYFDVDRAVALPAAVVIAGWAPFARGQLGAGPEPASLEPILSSAGVTEHGLIEAMDEILNLDSASPPTLLAGGELREMVNTAFASMIMYHNERKMAGGTCMSLGPTHMPVRSFCSTRMSP